MLMLVVLILASRTKSHDRVLGGPLEIRLVGCGAQPAAVHCPGLFVADDGLGGEILEVFGLLDEAFEEAVEIVSHRVFLDLDSVKLLKTNSKSGATDS